jgi:hypothetical protein
MSLLRRRRRRRRRLPPSVTRPLRARRASSNAERRLEAVRQKALCSIRSRQNQDSAEGRSRQEAEAGRRQEAGGRRQKEAEGGKRQEAEGKWQSEMYVQHFQQNHVKSTHISNCICTCMLIFNCFYLSICLCFFNPLQAARLSLSSNTATTDGENQDATNRLTDVTLSRAC